jgi:hypothetical protein
MTTSITSANIVLTLGVVGLFDTPQTIRGFAPDAAVATQAAAIGESQVGVDGFIAHGFVFGIMPIEVDLLANSPSIKFFDDWIAAELAVREKLLCFGTVAYPSVGKKFTFTDGGLAQHPGIIGAKKVLDTQKYIINVSTANMIPELS